MGYLLIDHSQGQGLDERQGRKMEYDTVCCAHCQSLIALLARPKETIALANLDVARATHVAGDLKAEYRAKHTCRRCCKPLCRTCAAKGRCTPFLARLERAIKVGRWEEAWEYRYNQCLGR